MLIGCSIEPHIAHLEGLGNKILSTYGKTTVIVECEDVSFELDLFIVRDSELEYDAMIGRNVVQHNDIVIVTDTSGARLYRKSVSTKKSKHPNFFH